MFHNLHSSLAPPKLRKSSSESPNSSIENLSSVGSPPTMSETKRKAPQAPAHGVHSGIAPQMVPLPPSRSTSRAHHIPIREIENPVYDEQDGSQNGKRPSLPLPDYETLFPQKRHGVHGFTRWDHIIAEVNQRRREGEEMSVDGPEEHMPSPKAPAMQERSAVSHQHIKLQEAKPTSTKKLAAPAPPKPVATTTPRQVVDSSQKQNQGIVQALPSVERPDMSALPGSPINTDTSSRDARSVMPKDGVKKALHPTAKLTDNKYMLPREMPRPATQRSGDKQVPGEDQNEVPIISTRQTLELAAPTPPKPVATTTPRQVVDSSQKQNQGIVQALPSVERPDMSALPGSPINTDTSSRDARSVMPKDGVKKALHPAAKLTDNKYMLPREVPRPATQRSGDKQVPAEDQNEVPIISTRQTPTAKPRQKTPMKQPDVTPVASSNTLNSNTQILSHPAVNDTDKKIRDTFSQSDPFPSTDLLPKDPWEQLDQNPSVDDIFTRGGDRQQKLEHQGLTSEDLDHIFTTDIPADPFSIFHGSDSEKHSAQGKKDVDSNQHSSTFQRQPSLTKMKMHQFQSHSVKDAGIQHNHTPKEEMANQSLTTKEDPTSTESFTRPHQGNVRMQNGFHGGERVETHCREDPFGPGPLTVNSSSPMPALTTPEPFQLDGEEPTSQAGGLPGGKTLLRAWVSPSEVQPHSAQNSNGGGLGSTPRRPHPVKPLSAVESPQPINTPAVREIKIHDSTVGKKKVPDSVGTGPYTQLTQEELITLVVKQQAELSKKDAKIMELEEYIDNLLVRVIEEKPSILLSLTDGKPT